jgi:DNA-binding protein HU-beta
MAVEVAGRIIKAMGETIESGEGVELRGGFSLEVKPRPVRTARNPHTGEAVTVPAGRRIVFRPGQEWKKALKE